MTQAESRKLQRDLEAYSGLTTISNNHASGWRRRAGNWPAYAAAAGSALALATAAEANTIIYSGPQNLTATAPRCRGTHVLIDIDGKGHTFSLEAVLGCGYSYRYAALSAPNGGQVIDAGSNVKGLPFGARISGHVTGFARSGVLHRSATSINGSTKTQGGTFGKRGFFAGVKFTDAGNVHYGWIAIEFRMGPATATNVTAISWAYNDVAGAPILAGQIYNDTPGPVPPPAATALSGNIALALLSTGSDGVLAWRRRRAESLAPVVIR